MLLLVAEFHGLPGQLAILGIAFGDFDELVGRDISKSLEATRGGPEDLENRDASRLAQPNLLAERIRAKTAAARHPFVNGAPLPRLVDFGPDSRADTPAIGLFPNQLDCEPVIAEAGVFEECARVDISCERSAKLNEEILVAVVVEIGE